MLSKVKLWPTSSKHNSTCTITIQFKTSLWLHGMIFLLKKEKMLWNKLFELFGTK